MHSQSIGNVDQNYIAFIPSDAFEIIVADFPYNPILKNLGSTSKALQAKVFALPCGEDLKELNALQPSYLRAFFATDDGFDIFVTGGVCAGIAIGAYVNYDTILSTYLGTLVGSYAGAAVSCMAGGYIINGIEGVKMVFVLSKSSKFTPYVKAVIKTEFMLVDKVLSTSFQKIIKETPLELIDGYLKNARKNLSIFKDTNRDFKYDLEQKAAKKHRELSKVIARK